MFVMHHKKILRTELSSDGNVTSSLRIKFFFDSPDDLGTYVGVI